ncbi:phage minor head protein [Sphaerisporangium siamense]|uniref:GNAT superfamily N-acetyltransferase n=1 Tax=Sphaerisporangium siamense TaxID=795645 RepID=A0A7W7G8X5_9ACTN|nr:phage minor head protein [Sphaerisporangium siamense]MBB4702233.1 GNAT superfamily N-acetyltransferase [Sphaerisporangium siamense]
MAITERTLRLVREMRANLDKIVDEQTRATTRAWVRAWDELIDAFNAAADALIAAATGGRWPSRREVTRSQRVQRALDLAARSLGDLALKASNDVAQAAWQAVHLAVEGTDPILLSQMPGSPRARAGIRFGRIDERAVGWIVQRTTEQINARHWPLAADATEAMRRELVRGVVLGSNPREAARRMVDRCEGEFNGGLARATNIARTEILDAHRAGAQAAQDANAATLAGWVWTAKLDARSCASCWAQHGQLHPLDEPGPLDHQSGRCARTPKTKSWRELGIDLDEPDDVIPDARAVFDALSRSEQLAILGPARLGMLEDGEISWDDLSTRRSVDGWRDSYNVTPLRDLGADRGPAGTLPEPHTRLTPDTLPATDQQDTRAPRPEPKPGSPANSSRPGIGALIPTDADDAAARETDIRAAVTQHIEGTYAGFTATVSAVRVMPNRLIISGTFHRADAELGEFIRSLHRDSDGTLWAKHGLLELQPDAQGQGLAAAFNRHLLEWYVDSGVDRVELLANIDVGGYAWARAGYDWAAESSARRCLNRLEQVLDRARYDLADAQSSGDDAQAAELVTQLQMEIGDAEQILERGRTVEFGADDFPTPYEISQAGRRSGRTRWIGKQAMLGTTWQAVRWLR